MNASGTARGFFERSRAVAWRFAWASAVCAGVLCAAGAEAPPPDKDLPGEMKRLVDVYSILDQNAADPVEPDRAFYQGAIPGLLRRLDPHSVFFDSGQFEQLKQMQKSTSKGFGSVVSVLPGRVIVLQALAGTPSARSGIAPGDEILAINNIRLDRLEFEQLLELLTESRQQPARLDVRRPGNASIMQFTLVPEEMQTPSVERAFLLEPGIGYLRVTSFDEKTGADVHDAVEKLGGGKLSGLVLDLRNNPGGLMNAALDTCALFLKPGQVILSARGRHFEAKEEKTPQSAKPYAFRVAVLINGKSASAAEIVAGALQDHDRAIVVGETSFGKGLVESVYPLSQGTGLALTTALYYTPSGRSIQKPWGDTEFALAATASHPNTRTEFKTDQGRVVKGGGGITPDVPIAPAAFSRFRQILEVSASFPIFATDYLRRNKISEGWDVDAKVLDEFQTFLSEHQIQPSIGEWSRERDFIQNRLKTEIYNQSFGVAKGDEVEAQRDPQIRAAVKAIHLPPAEAAP